MRAELCVDVCFIQSVFSAFVLLCLLNAVFVQADYSWGGPGSNKDTVDLNTENGEVARVKVGVA